MFQARRKRDNRVSNVPAIRFISGTSFSSDADSRRFEHPPTPGALQTSLVVTKRPGGPAVKETRVDSLARRERVVFPRMRARGSGLAAAWLLRRPREHGQGSLSAAAFFPRARSTGQCDRVY